jgi:hypothetical protein
MPMDWGLARDYAARAVRREEMHVTEADWLACADPSDLDLYLGEIGARPGERKLRLFGCACVRGPLACQAPVAPLVPVIGEWFALTEVRLE